MMSAPCITLAAHYDFNLRAFVCDGSKQLNLGSQHQAICDLLSWDCPPGRCRWAVSFRLGDPIPAVRKIAFAFSDQDSLPAEAELLWRKDSDPAASWQTMTADRSDIRDKNYLVLTLPDESYLVPGHRFSLMLPDPTLSSCAICGLSMGAKWDESDVSVCRKCSLPFHLQCNKRRKSKCLVCSSGLVAESDSGSVGGDEKEKVSDAEPDTKRKKQRKAAADGSSEIFYVETILDHRLRGRSKPSALFGNEWDGAYVYLIKWLNYTAEYNSWEPESCLLPGSEQVLREYVSLQKSKTDRKALDGSDSFESATSLPRTVLVNASGVPKVPRTPFQIYLDEFKLEDHQIMLRDSKKPSAKEIRDKATKMWASNVPAKVFLEVTARAKEEERVQNRARAEYFLKHPTKAIDELQKKELPPYRTAYAIWKSDEEARSKGTAADADAKDADAEAGADVNKEGRMTDRAQFKALPEETKKAYKVREAQERNQAVANYLEAGLDEKKGANKRRTRLTEQQQWSEDAEERIIEAHPNWTIQKVRAAVREEWIKHLDEEKKKKANSTPVAKKPRIVLSTGNPIPAVPAQLPSQCLPAPALPAPLELAAPPIVPPPALPTIDAGLPEVQFAAPPKIPPPARVTEPLPDEGEDLWFGIEDQVSDVLSVLDGDDGGRDMAEEINALSKQPTVQKRGRPKRNSVSRDSNLLSDDELEVHSPDIPNDANGEGSDLSPPRLSSMHDKRDSPDVPNDIFYEEPDAQSSSKNALNDADTKQPGARSLPEAQTRPKAIRKRGRPRKDSQVPKARAQSKQGTKRGRPKKPKPVDDEFEVEAIQGEKQTPEGKFYFVKWAGYPKEKNTWEPQDSVAHLDALATWESRREMLESLTPVIDQDGQASIGCIDYGDFLVYI